MKRTVLLAGFAVLLSACDSRPPTDVLNPGDGTDLIQDATHNGGNPAFHWLSPIVDDALYSGEFNGLLQPEVVICALADATQAGADACAGAPVWTFTMASGPAPDPTATVSVSTVDEHYRVNWHTGRFDLQQEDYRVIVYLSTLPDAPVIGVADIALAENRGAFRNMSVDPDTEVPLVDGQTLPIKFRIEKGVSCTDPLLDCGEGMTDPTSDVVITTASGEAGVLVPAGATNEPVLITVNESARRPCLPTGLVQDSGVCFDFDTQPDLTTAVVNVDGHFNTNVTVGLCPTPGFDPDDRALIHKFDPNNAATGVVDLPGAAETFLSCPTTAAAGDGLLGRFAHAVRTLLGPRPLFAKDEGRGGVTDAFSFMTWAIPNDLALVNSLGVVAPGGTIQPTVSAMTSHNHGQTALPVDGATLRFELTDPTGASQVVYEPTSSGQAAPSLTLTQVAGVHTLTVSTRMEALIGGQQQLIADPTTVLTIEVGASSACDQAVDCIEQVVTPDGAVVTSPSGLAGVDIGPGAVDGPIVVTIRQVDGASQPWGQCLPTGLRQEDYCYEFDTQPALGDVNQQDAFNNDVTVGVCVDPNAVREEHLKLHKYDPEQPAQGVLDLPAAATTFLACDGPVVSAAPPEGFLGRLGWTARRAIRPVVELVTPTTLYAKDEGRGGVTDAFSFFGWAEPVSLAMAVQPDATTAGVVDVLVTATTAHNHTGFPATAADGHTIRFEWTDPSSAITLQHVVTDASGQARISLAPPSPTTVGTHTVTASTRDSVELPIVVATAPPSVGGFLGAPTLQSATYWFLVPDPTTIVSSGPIFVSGTGVGSIQGRVTDSNQAPLVGATVVVQGTTLGSLTDVNGNYRITNVPAGTRTVQVTLVGYLGTSQSVDVPAGGTVTADFQLSPAPTDGIGP